MSLIKIIFFGIMLTAVPSLAMAVIYTSFETRTLTCGTATITAKTTYLINTDFIEPQVLEQNLIWRNNNKQKKLKIDSKYVIKYIPKARKVLDAALELWGCQKSKLGKYYFYLFYYCTEGEEQGFCVPKGRDPNAPGRVEFERYLREDGTRVIKGPRSWQIRPKDEIIYKSLGLDDENRKSLQIKSIHE